MCVYLPRDKSSEDGMCAYVKKTTISRDQDRDRKNGIRKDTNRDDLFSTFTAVDRLCQFISSGGHTEEMNQSNLCPKS